ncbi:dual specificity protein phosphatase family protein [Candidatus Uhrbacteria bacterium]|nr:dual specificity protein phosphatase family protein [Candidatus Uhrbacteria bacterium]
MRAHEEGETPFEYNSITDQIIIGTNQCCQSHFDETLLAQGVTVDISLEEEKLDAPFGVELYAWIPVKDHTPPTRDQLEMGVGLLASIIRCGKKVYVHCKNGHGRAPTLVSAYLIRQGMSVEQAITAVHAQRPVIHLEPSQKEALEAFIR